MSFHKRSAQATHRFAIFFWNVCHSNHCFSHAQLFSYLRFRSNTKMMHTHSVAFILPRASYLEWAPGYASGWWARMRSCPPPHGCQHSSSLKAARVLTRIHRRFYYYCLCSSMERSGKGKPVYLDTINICQ